MRKWVREKMLRGEWARQKEEVENFSDERVIKEGDFDQGKLTLTSKRLIYTRGDARRSIALTQVRSVNVVRKGLASQQTLEIRYKEGNEVRTLDFARVSVSAALLSPTLYTIRQDPMYSEWASAINESVSRYREKLSSSYEPKEETALEILKKRYARGEITKEQYEQMKKDIES